MINTIKKETESLMEYKKTFVQNLPWYTVKQINGRWKTKKKYLADTPVKAHLQGKYDIGVLGKWYPSYCILDFDNVSEKELEKVRDMLGQDEHNSMRLSSQSINSSHVLSRPSCNNKPPTIRLLQDAFKLFAKQNNIEIYPQANRTIRLPFGHGQNCLDIEYIHLKDWEEKFYWFQKLDDFKLSNIPYYQPELDLKIENPGQPNTYREGEYLLKNGLQEKSSRNESQFKILNYLFRNNIPQRRAIEITWKVIKYKHNGYSKDIITKPGACKKEIERQAGIIYNNYELASIYPDETHNEYNGFITKGDIADIIRINPNLARMKFFYHLIKFCNPRRHRNFIDIHSNKLKEWSSKDNYLKFLDELTRSGIVKRFNKYSADRFAKSIKIKWNFRDPANAILEDNRAPISFEDTIKLSHNPEEFRELLKKSGSGRTTAIETVKRIYKSVKN